MPPASVCQEHAGIRGSQEAFATLLAKNGAVLESVVVAQRESRNEITHSLERLHVRLDEIERRAQDRHEALSEINHTRISELTSSIRALNERVKANEVAREVARKELDSLKQAFTDLKARVYVIGVLGFVMYGGLITWLIKKLS